MLIETLGVGRVSTIYRAAWKPKTVPVGSQSNNDNIQMVALKVAMINPETHDFLNIQELRRKFAITACLQHPPKIMSKFQEYGMITIISPDV
jgi:hypothetical protein